MASRGSYLHVQTKHKFECSSKLTVYRFYTDSVGSVFQSNSGTYLPDCVT